MYVFLTFVCPGASEAARTLNACRARVASVRRVHISADTQPNQPDGRGGGARTR